MAALENIQRYWIFLFFVAANVSESDAQQKIAKLILQLTDSLCSQHSEFLSSKVLQPPLKKPVTSRKYNGGFIWTSAKSAGGVPFNFYSNEGNKKEYPRVERRPATPNGYPSLVAIERNPRNHAAPNNCFQGHAIFLSELHLLTSAIHAYPGEMDSYQKYGYLVLGNRRQDSIRLDAKLCKDYRHPNFDKETNRYNFGIIQFEKPAPIPEGLKTMEFAKEGQKFSGPCKVVSWTNIIVTDSFQKYADELSEASVEILPEEECKKAGFTDTHVCTRPVLCGVPDSGAPLICSENGTDYLYGIASHYPRDHKKPKFCGGNPLSAFSLVSKIDMNWVQKTFVEADDMCKRKKVA